MNFEQTYKKYLDGTANEEEKAYVEAEIEKSRRLLDMVDVKEEPKIEMAERAVIKKAKKKHTLRSTLRTAGITLLIIAVIAGAVLGGVLGTAAVSAKDSLHPDLQTRGDAVNFAKKFLIENGYSGSIEVIDCDRELEVRSKLNKSYYVYEIEVYTDYEDIDLRVDGRTGKVTIDY